MTSAPPQPGKQLMQEGSMLGGSFTMVRFYDLEPKEEEIDPNTIFLRLLVSDRATGFVAPYDFDASDLRSLEVQLNEKPFGYQNKTFLKSLYKNLVVVRKDDKLYLSFKNLLILTPEEKQRKRDQEIADQLAREQFAREEQARLEKIMQERLEAERLAKIREEEEALRIANMTPEEREYEANMKNQAYLDQLNTLIDMVDAANQDEHLQLKRPTVAKPKRRQKTVAATTFKQMEEEEEIREEESRKPRGQVDQEWDDPLELLAEYKKATQEKTSARSVFLQMAELQKKMKKPMEEGEE